MKITNKKQLILILLLLLDISLYPIFGQNTSKIDLSEILLVNSSNSCWPKLLKSNQVYEFSKSGDSLTIKIIPIELTATARDAANVSVTYTSWTTKKKQIICIPLEMNNNINVVILLIGDCLDVDEYCVYSFVRKKDDYFKLKYLNKNAKKMKNIVKKQY